MSDSSIIKSLQERVKKLEDDTKPIKTHDYSIRGLEGALKGLEGSIKILEGNFKIAEANVRLFSHDLTIFRNKDLDPERLKSRIDEGENKTRKAQRTADKAIDLIKRDLENRRHFRHQMDLQREQRLLENPSGNIQDINQASDAIRSLEWDLKMLIQELGQPVGNI